MKYIKPIILFTVGGLLYIIIEILWRMITNSAPTHWSMFIVGGLSFILVGAINEHLSWNLSIWLQGAIGTLIVLVIEFVSGCILNLWLGLEIWDYSNMPFNILGQICLPFAIAWYALVIIAIITDDYLRYWLFKEDKPEYKWKFTNR